MKLPEPLRPFDGWKDLTDYPTGKSVRRFASDWGPAAFRLVPKDQEADCAGIQTSMPRTVATGLEATKTLGLSHRAANSTSR